MAPVSAFWSLGLYGPSVILCGLCASVWSLGLCHLSGLWAFMAPVSSLWPLHLDGPVSSLWALRRFLAPVLFLWPLCFCGRSVISTQEQVGKMGKKRVTVDNFTVRVQLVKFR